MAGISVADGKLQGLENLVPDIITVSSLTAIGEYGKMQAASLESTLDSMEDQLDDLKEQKEDYQKTLADTSRQIDYAADQMVSGAESSTSPSSPPSSSWKD